MSSKVLLKYLFMIVLISFSLSEKIKLPEPQTTGGMPLFEVLAKRQSQRDYSIYSSLTEQEMSQILWAAYGPNREDGGKTVPSAVAMYPFDIYAFTEKGCYKYLPSTNELEVIRTGDYREVTGLDFYAATANMDVCLLGLYEREWMAADKKTAEKTMREDSGFVTANMYLVAASLGLKAVTRARFEPERIMDTLYLNREEYYIPLCFSISH